MKKDIVLFVLIEPFADWEGAALAAELQKPSLDNPEKTFTVKTVSLSHEPSPLEVSLLCRITVLKMLLKITLHSS